MVLKGKTNKRQNTILNRFLFGFCHVRQNSSALLHSQAYCFLGSQVIPVEKNSQSILLLSQAIE